MGVMRFHAFPTERITGEMLKQTYVSGLDRVAWPTQASVEGEELVLSRAVSDSGNVHLPWPTEDFGPLMLTTGALMERPAPYLLPLEIARGAIVQLRNQLCEWQVVGLSVPEAIQAKVAEAVVRFSWAAVTQDEPAVCAEHAEAALRLALAAADALAALYADQALAIRRRSGGKLETLLGADLGGTLLDNSTARQYLRTFNAAKVPIAWRDIETTEGSFSWSTSDHQIEWCRKHGLTVVAGPLLMLDAHELPHWFYLFEDDFESALEFASAFVRAAVQRYRGKVDYWVCAGRVNSSDAVALSERERVGLVARIVALVRALDPNTPRLVSFDQPRAEYLRERESDFPPLHFADALVRADVGLSGLMMEMNVGYWPGGSQLRHPLEFSRLLDTWSQLGLPLWLSLSAPSGDQEDPVALHREAVPARSWSPAAQEAWIARHVPLALAKPSVQGILWNQLCDSRPHDFPNGGLFDAHRKPKPSLRRLAAIRQTHLK